MNVVDILILAPIAWTVINGFRKGVIIELSGFIALILGVYGAVKFGTYLETHLTQVKEIDDSFIPILAFLLTFIGIVIAVHFLAKLIHKVVHLAAMGMANRISGAVFGLLKGALIVMALAFVFDRINDHIEVVDHATLNKSVMYNTTVEGAESLWPFFEKKGWMEELQDDAQKKIDETSDKITDFGS